jgi:uncharacterized protein YifN (PemK superfamily)
VKENKFPKSEGVYDGYMSINFAPKAGQVLMCNFGMASVPPEMGKIRHVVVLSPRRRRNSGTFLVVPLSTVAPNPIEPYHYRIRANKYSFLS